MSARVRLGHGERLVFIGHEVAIVCRPDEEDGHTGVYFAADWNGATAPAAILDNDGDAAFLDGFGRAYRWARVRDPRCDSERARAERIFARDFRDAMRVQP